VKVIADAHRANLTGLALSGGGIRSATFNLGALQALADLNLLSRIDYLSTVSGGGYIGGWLAAWTKRLGSFAEVQKRLAAKRVHQAEDREPEQIRFLRVFSNYLTPKVGPFSADTWCAAAIILRNILLNLVVLLPSLVALLLLLRAVMGWGITLQAAIGRTETWVSVVFGLLLFAAIASITINMVYLDAKKRSLWTKQGTILVSVARVV
jgi:Patatin-like phospholipase